MRKSFVAVFAHPDDEAFGPAGTIAQYARDHDVYILSATKGEAGQNSKIGERKLSDIRADELRTSAKILGVKDVFFLGFEDGTLCNNLYHKLADAIREKLEEFRPETILTFEPRGVSGHIDHITVAMATTFVFYKLPFVKTLLQHTAKAEYTDLRKDYFIYFPPGYKRSDVDKIVNIEDVWEKKVQAMQAHESQKQDVDRILAIQSKFPKEEYLLVTNK